jgi:hypothetical protein
MNVNSATRTTKQIAPLLAAPNRFPQTSLRELFLRHLFSNSLNLTYALLQACQANVSVLSSQRTLYFLSQRPQWEDWKTLVSHSPYVAKWSEKRRASYYKLTIQFSDGSGLKLIFLDHFQLRQSVKLDSESLLRSVSINSDQVKVPALVFVYEFWLKGGADENPHAYRDGIQFFSKLSEGEKYELKRYMRLKYGGNYFLPI